MHNAGRARGLRRFVRFASVGVVFGWFAVFFGLGPAAWRHRLFTAVNLYQTVGMVAMAWLITLMWTAAREKARSEQVLDVHGAWGRAADKLEAIVTRAEKALFWWTPYLCAVFWVLYGASTSTAMSTERAGWRGDQSLMYFMLAAVFTVMLTKGVAGHYSQWAANPAGLRRWVVFSVVLVDSAIAVAAGFTISNGGNTPMTWFMVLMLACLVFFLSVRRVPGTGTTRRQEPPGPDQKSTDSRAG